MHIVHTLVTAKLGRRIAIESGPGRGTVARVTCPGRASAAATSAFAAAAG